MLLVSSRASLAAFVGPNAGSVAGITYAVETVNAAGGAIYGANGELVNIAGLPGAGAGYGSLGAPVTPVSTFGGGIGVPGAPLGALSAFQAAVPASGFGDTLGGQASLNATTFGGGSGAGIIWTSPTFLYDTGFDNKASVNFSRGIAIFSDPLGDMGKIPGVALAISGTLGGQGAAGAFVAAALNAVFSIFNNPNAAGAPISTFSTSVAIVTDGPGGRNDFVTRTPSIGGDTFFSGSIGLGTNVFSAFGVDLLPAVNIPAGGSVKIDATLSLVADPDASLTLDFFPLTVPLPDFGPIGMVPEPGSIVMMSLGLLATLGVCRWRRRVTSPRHEEA